MTTEPSILATNTLPRRLVHFALAGGIVLLTPISAITGEPERVAWATVGALGAFVALAVLHVVARGGFGYGDVRLGAMLGWYLAWQGLRYVPVGLFLHTLIYFTLGAPFFSWIGLYSVFVPWSAAVAWLRARGASGSVAA